MSTATSYNTETIYFQISFQIENQMICEQKQVLEIQTLLITNIYFKLYILFTKMEGQITILYYKQTTRVNKVVSSLYAKPMNDICSSL